MYGSALKLGGNEYGLFLALVDNNEKIILDETKWTQVENICTNRPDQIDFIVPKQYKPKLLHFINFKFLPSFDFVAVHEHSGCSCDNFCGRKCNPSVHKSEERENPEYWNQAKNLADYRK